VTAFRKGFWCVFVIFLGFLSLAAAQSPSPGLEERLGKLEQLVERLQKSQEEMALRLPPPLPATIRAPIRAGTRSWGPEQATGMPDTRGYGDLPTAWATQNRDGGEEWLELSFERAVPIQKVRVFCSFNPGALTKITTFQADGQEAVFWEGEQPPKDEVDVFEVAPKKNAASSQKIKLYLDTKRKSGWNEIDAVEIVAADGASQWAQEAKASSFYGEGSGVGNAKREVAPGNTATRPGSLKSPVTPFEPPKNPKVGEVVAVKWNSSWWAGRILEVRPNQRFQITYLGWGDSWNEEVGLDRLGVNAEADEISEQQKNPSAGHGRTLVRPVFGGPEVGQEAPGFEVKTTDDEMIKLADYRGKYVLLDFWATWCGPCRGETPNLKAVYEQFGKRENFVMIGLSLDQEKDKPITYANEKGTQWINGFLGDWGKDEVTKKYGVRGIPSIWLVGPDGKVVAKGLRGEGIMEAVRTVLEEGKK